MYKQSKMKTVASFSLLAFLPALTFAFFLPFPMHFENTNVNETPKITPEDVCPFIHYINNELCSNDYSHYARKEVVKNTVFYHSRHEQKFDPKQLCPLFSYLNKTYCSSSETVDFVSHIDADIANRIKRIKHIFEGIERNERNDTNKSNNNNDTYDFGDHLDDPKELCPLIELVDKTFCKSETLIQNKIDPKDLCPILKDIDTKLCS
jgi:hypothetical protein